MGMGQKCTKTKLHKDKFVQEDKLHKDNLARRVNFAQVTVLHGWSFCLRVKKKKLKRIQKER